MDYFTLLLKAIGIILMALFLNRKEKKENDEHDEIDKGKPDEFPDLNEVFLNNVKGRVVVDLVKVFNPQEQKILRSILAFEGIETYVKSNHFGELYPTYDLHNFSTSVISIYKYNSIKAKQIVENYLRTLKKESYRDTGFLEDTVITSSLLVGIPPQLSKFLPELLI